LTGNYFNPNYLLRLFKKVLADAGLPHMRFHDLRHSAATMLLAMGIHPKVVQELLGHSSYQFAFCDRIESAVCEMMGSKNV
jgi:integrase